MLPKKHKTRHQIWPANSVTKRRKLLYARPVLTSPSLLSLSTSSVHLIDSSQKVQFHEPNPARFPYFQLSPSILVKIIIFFFVLSNED